MSIKYKSGYFTTILNRDLVLKLFSSLACPALQPLTVSLGVSEPVNLTHQY